MEALIILKLFLLNKAMSTIAYVVSDDYEAVLQSLAEDYGDIDHLDNIAHEELARRFTISILPGTKWCGAGNSATGNELGTFADTDRCCRTHDRCDDIIPAGESKYNLTNPSAYTRLHCKCDYEFYYCLKATPGNGIVSGSVGKAYFNVLGTQCFREEYPIVNCLKYSGYTNKKCIKYSFDYTAPKVYSWFDVPYY